MPDVHEPEDRKPPASRRLLTRVRVVVVLVALVAVVVVAAGIGAAKLFSGVPERTTQAPVVTCWNGTVGTVAQCPQPSGRAGLHWVFPSFDPEDPRCTEVRRRGRGQVRPTEYSCALSYGRRPVTVVYSVRTSIRGGLKLLRRTYGTKPVTDGDQLVFTAPRPDADGTYRVTAAYAEQPYSVTVAAQDPELRDTALAEIVELRPAAGLLLRG